MNIAIHIPVSHGQRLTETFSYRAFVVLAEKYPTHSFVFIFDKPVDPGINFPKNVTVVPASPQIKNRLLQHYFFNYKIPSILIKYKITLFVCTDVCSLRTNIPQCLLLHDLSFLQKHHLFNRNDVRYLKRYTKTFIRKAAQIAVLNEALKSTLVASFGTSEQKITVINNGIGGYAPVATELQEAMRQQLTQSKQYFIFFATASSSANSTMMLKAFSIFKKWQKSNMELLIISTDTTPGIADFSNYKYRSEVQFISLEHELGIAAIIGSSYAAIHLPSIEISETVGLQAMASGIPLITVNSAFNHALFKDAAAYVSPDEKSIAEAMMLLYKDERHRGGLIAKGKIIAESHTWEAAADSVWRMIGSFKTENSLTLQKNDTVL